MDTEGSRPVCVSIDEIYRQQYAHFSRMNDLFYKLPIGFSTVIGGLWFFGTSMIEKDQFFAAVVFLFVSATPFPSCRL